MHSQRQNFCDWLVTVSAIVYPFIVIIIHYAVCYNVCFWAILRFLQNNTTKVNYHQRHLTLTQNSMGRSNPDLFKSKRKVSVL